MELKLISKFNFLNRTVSLLVCNRNDVIQRCHYNGYFYEQEELGDLMLVLPTGANVFDIGANVGNHSIYFSIFGRNVNVVPFEVNPPAIEILRENIKLNSLESRIDTTFLGIGLGNSHGYLCLANGDRIVDNLGAARFELSIEESAIPVTRLDHLNLKSKPDLIKIDVEGMELKVLEGAENTIITSRPVLYVEVSTENREKFKKLIGKWGYSIERTHQRHRGIINYLCVPW